MKFAPNGARLRYCVMIHSLDLRRSIFSAMTDSFHFHQARRALSGRTPRCVQNVPSSDATSAWTIQSFRSAV